MIEIGTDTMATVSGRPVTVLRLTGELELATAVELQSRIGKLLDAGGSRVVIDLAGLGFCDVTGVKALLSVQKRCAERQGWIRLVGAPRRIRRLLEAARLTGRLPCYYSVEQALAEQNAVVDLTDRPASGPAQGSPVPGGLAAGPASLSGG